MSLIHAFTHRRVFSTFSAVEAHRAEQLLAAQGIPCLVEKHSSTQSVTAFGTLPEYEIAYDIAVPNEYYNFNTGTENVFYVDRGQLEGLCRA